MRTNLIMTILRFFVLGVILSLSLTINAMAQVSFQWVTVGDPNNAVDTRVMNKGLCTTPGVVGCVGDMTTGYGSVGYEYQIAKHHVTMSQYAEFLNAVDPNGTNSLGLYDDRMEEFIIPEIPFDPSPAFTGGIDFDEDPNAMSGSKYSAKSGQENYPANYISWASAARFVNWLSNGQGSGDTESGVYEMIPTTTSDPVPTREPGSSIFLPSEDEFYKAAYYNPTLNGGTGGYTEYGVGNAAPIIEDPNGSGSTSANHSQTDGVNGPSGDTYWQNSGGSFTHNQIYLTEVGAYSAATSYYGLFDVDGNARQWMETSKENPFNANQDLPISRGGSWLHGTDGSGASFRQARVFAAGSSDISSHLLGIRIAQAIFAEADFDKDGDVDGVDLAIWETSYSVDAGADTDGDGDSDGDDFLVWQQQFTGSLPLSAVTSVPEPSSVVLLFTLVATCGLCRQRRVAS